MKTIAILCGGPPKKDRNRHLEIFNNKPCITHVIDACTFDNNKICVVLSSENHLLKRYVQNFHPHVKILESNDYTMLTSYKLAFNEDENDTLIIAGDLWNLKKENVEKFLNSPYKSAIYRLKTPWGKGFYSFDKKLYRRGDIGDSLLLVANEHQKQYLSQENIDRAIHYYKQFYPNTEFCHNQGNHLWTWLDYTFFHEISSSQEGVINNVENERGAIYIEDLVYLDND